LAIWKFIRIFDITNKQKVWISSNPTKKMATQMTRKEAATIMKKYEKNGMIGIKVKQEYFIAKQRWNEIVKEQRN
jgi:ribosomal protein L19E